jgi:hypothetical protein
MILGFTYAEIFVGFGLFLASTLVTSAVVIAFLVLMPHDHFLAHGRPLRERIQSPIARGLVTVAKNALGVALVAIGIVLSLPGVPGQGLLTILVGILLLDVPGKRRLEEAIVRRPAVLRGINRLRERFGRRPLELEAAS